MKFEAVLFNDAGAPVVAVGIIIEKIRMDEIVEKLFNRKLAGVTWLTELTVGKAKKISNSRFYICSS